MSTSVQWYGERGVVNALVTQVAAHGVAAGIAFLNCIKWGDQQARPWLNQVNRIDYVIEVGLSRFGDPDLIIVCTSVDDSGMEKRHAIFIEAKVISYQESVEKGGPSSINRQLTLKYRFAQAMQTWRGDLQPIAETDTWHSAYYPSDESATVREDSPVPRQIAKRSVIQICRNANLNAIPIDDIYFVAWTWDREPFFGSCWDDFTQSAGRPMFMDQHGNEILKEFASRIGWLGYQHIDSCPVLKEVLDHSYRAAFESMLPSLTPEIPVTTDTTQLQKLVTRNIRTLKNHEIKNQLQALIGCAQAVFGVENVSIYAGSVSITLYYAGLGYRKVLIKLVPQGHGQADERITLGVSASLGRSTWADLSSDELRSIGTDRNAQPFYMFDIPSGEAGESFTEAVFDQVAELLLDNDGDQES